MKVNLKLEIKKIIHWKAEMWLYKDQRYGLLESVKESRDRESVLKKDTLLKAFLKLEIKKENFWKAEMWFRNQRHGL